MARKSNINLVRTVTARIEPMFVNKSIPLLFIRLSLLRNWIAMLKRQSKCFVTGQKNTASNWCEVVKYATPAKNRSFHRPSGMDFEKFIVSHFDNRMLLNVTFKSIRLYPNPVTQKITFAKNFCPVPGWKKWYLEHKSSSKSHDIPQSWLVHHTHGCKRIPIKEQLSIFYLIFSFWKKCYFMKGNVFFNLDWHLVSCFGC